MTGIYMFPLILEDCSLQGLHARIVVEVSAQPGFAVGKMTPQRLTHVLTWWKRLIEMWRWRDYLDSHYAESVSTSDGTGFRRCTGTGVSRQRMGILLYYFTREWEPQLRSITLLEPAQFDLDALSNNQLFFYQPNINPSNISDMENSESPKWIKN